MKVIKIIAAIILSIALIGAGSAAMGVFSIDRAVSEESVSKAMEETGIVQELTDEVISENTVNMGGKYGEVINGAIKTDAMNDFFSSYISTAIRSDVYGEPYEEIGSDDLMNAFSAAMDELKAENNIQITSEEEEIIRAAMLREIPDLTENINENIKKYDTTSIDLGNEENSAQFLTQSTTKILTVVASIILCAIIIALFWRSKAGFIWCAVVFGIAALIYMGLGMMGGGGIIDITSGSVSERFVIRMLSEGFSDASKAGFIIMALFIAAYIVLRIKDRRKS